MINDKKITRVFKLLIGCLFVILVSWLLFILIDKFDLYNSAFGHFIYYISYFAVFISFYLGIILFLFLIYLVLRKFISKKT